MFLPSSEVNNKQKLLIWVKLSVSAFKFGVADHMAKMSTHVYESNKFISFREINLVVSNHRTAY